MKIDVDKAKEELLSAEKINLPKWVIFIGFMSSLTTQPIALFAYMPVILNIIGLLSGSEFNLWDSLGAVLISMCLLVLLVCMTMKSMEEEGVLELYLSLTFERKAFPKFLKSICQKNQ